jgi:hypothetical protein
MSTGTGVHTTVPQLIHTHPLPPPSPSSRCCLPANAFAIYPPSTARSVGIVTMVLDQLTAYGLFVHPLLITWEKGLRVHHRPWYIRLPARLPVGEWGPEELGVWARSSEVKPQNAPTCAPALCNAASITEWSWHEPGFSFWTCCCIGSPAHDCCALFVLCSPDDLLHRSGRPLLWGEAGAAHLGGQPCMSKCQEPCRPVIVAGPLSLHMGVYRGGTSRCREEILSAAIAHTVCCRNGFCQLAPSRTRVAPGTHQL